MLKKLKRTSKRVVAFALSMLTIFTTIATSTTTAHAADGTLYFNSGRDLAYGSYFTTRMTFDGDNTAYCIEPYKKTPEIGSYSYDLLAQDSPLRKALYYLNGGYGYEKIVRDRCFQGWSDDDAYIVGHLALAYIYDGYSADEDAFYGAPQNFIDKTYEVIDVINSLPNPPKAFRAFIIPSDSRQSIAGSWYQKPYGWIELKKSGVNAGLTDGNGNYSLKGAKYGIYQGENQVAILTTDENGYAKSGDLEEGSYVVREIQASAGYAIDTQSYDVTVTSETVSTVAANEVPQNNPLELLLQKVDSELSENHSQGAASLANAEFTVKYYTEQSATDPAASGKAPARTWVFRADAEGKISFTKDYLVSGDEFYYQNDGATLCVPLGTVTIQEIKAPEGYLLNDTVFVQQIIGDGQAESVSCYQTTTVPEQVIRGDLEFVKVSDGDLNRLANVPFSITSKTTGESHVLVTDKNGYASTSADWTKHTANTNAGQSSSDGIWFGASEPDDSKGALFYDTYVIEEQRCDANEGMNLLKFEVTIYKDSVTVQLGTLTDDRIEVFTKALDKDTETQLSKADEKVTLIDTVEYEGLKRGQEYKIVGTLMDKDTGEPVVIDGKPVTSEKTFKAKKSSGTTEVTFTFNGVSLAGKTVVVFEALYYEELKLAVHADIQDEDQTIYFPEIGTTMKDSDTEDQISNADAEVTLVDTVSYKNLIPGKEYKMTGTLMNKDTEKPVENQGEAITAEITFVPEKTEGSVDVTFIFDGSELKGKTVVAFESVSYEGKELAVHADITDEGQTVYFPEIGTTAKDSETEQHVSCPDEEVTIVDTVSYENLIPGKEYKVTGVLMDKETQKELIVNEQKISAETVFIPEESKGTVEMVFTFDGSALKGKTVVAFEIVTYQEKEVASHTDIEDKEQTIYFPEIGTTAKDGADGDKEVSVESKVTIVDTVEYKNLVPGQKYHVVGTLMDKATGKELMVDGKNVASDVVFTAEKANGKVDVAFTFDGSSLKGHSLVVFEKLYFAEGEAEQELVAHEDLEDEGQTVKMVEKETPKPETPRGDAPKTGDENNAKLWIAIAALSASGLVTAGILKRKGKKNKK